MSAKEKLSVNQRIRAVKERFFGTNAEFAKRLNKNPQFISNIMRDGYSVSPATLRQILDVATDVNEVWLLTGEESMILPNESIESELYVNRNGTRFYELSNNMYTIEVPLVTINDYDYFRKQVSSFKYSKFPDLKRAFFISHSITNSGYIGLEVRGSSMQSADGRGLSHGDIVYAREVDIEQLPHAIFQAFNPYWIIVGENGVVCRKIDFTDIGNSEITLKPLNESLEYPSISVNLRNIYKLYNIERRSTDPR